MVCGIDVKTNRKVLELVEKYEAVKVCLGIYPTDGLKMSEDEVDDEIDFIRKNKEKVIGIGEVGLDLKESDEIKRQKIIFEKFIKLSKELDIPIVVHSRKAEKEAIEVLEKNNCKKVVMHCFNGNFKLYRQPQ